MNHEWATLIGLIFGYLWMYIHGYGAAKQKFAKGKPKGAGLTLPEAVQKAIDEQFLSGIERKGKTPGVTIYTDVAYAYGSDEEDPGPYQFSIEDILATDWEVFIVEERRTQK